MMLSFTSASTSSPLCMPPALTCNTRNLHLPPTNLHFNSITTKSCNLKSTFSTKIMPHPALRSKPTNFLEEFSPNSKTDFKNLRVLTVTRASMNFLEELSLNLMPDFKNLGNTRVLTKTRARKSDFEVWFNENFHPYGKMKEKPKWWWRSLASIFYLKPLLQFGAYGIFDPAYKVSTLLKNYGELTWEPHIRFIACFPQWLWYVYQTILYFTVRRTELPHYLRFHMINGFLIDMMLEISVYVNRWFPYSWLWSKIGMHVLMAIGIAYILTILECIRCALVGKYADVPFVSESSFIHTHVR